MGEEDDGGRDRVVEIELRVHAVPRPDRSAVDFTAREYAVTARDRSALQEALRMRGIDADVAVLDHARHTTILTQKSPPTTPGP